MVKRLGLLLVLAVLLSAGLFPLQAQDTSACNFTPDPTANVFDNLAKVADLGIKAKDINALAKAVQDPTVDPTEFLLNKGYDKTKIDEILTDPNNAELINQLIHPSPSRDIVDRAYALLASYGIPSGALIELYKLTSDRPAFYDNLIARGLSPEQANAMIDAALGLVEEAKSLGVFDYAATLDGQNVFDSHGYNINLSAVGNDLDDPQALREQLLQEGVSEADVDQMVGEFQTLNQEQGLTESYLNGWETKTLTYSLDYYGIPSDEVLSLAAQGDLDAIQACLANSGLDPSMIDIASSQLDSYLLADDGEDPMLTTLDIVEVALSDAGSLGAEWNLSGEDLAALGQLGDDPEALRLALMNNYGLSSEDADRFVAQYDNSAFSSVTFDWVDDASISELDGAIEATENNESFTLSDDFNVDSILSNSSTEAVATEEPTQTSSGNTSGGNTSGGNTSGGNTSGGDTSGGDTSGGDTSGGDTSGGDTSGGDTSGDTGGDTSGDTGGDTSGDTGGDTSGDTGGDTSGGDVTTPPDNSGDTSGGDTSGGDTSGGDTSGGDTGGDTSGDGSGG